MFSETCCSFVVPFLEASQMSSSFFIFQISVSVIFQVTVAPKHHLEHEQVCQMLNSTDVANVLQQRNSHWLHWTPGLGPESASDPVALSTKWTIGQTIEHMRNNLNFVRPKYSITKYSHCRARRFCVVVNQPVC